MKDTLRSVAWDDVCKYAPPPRLLLPLRSLPPLFEMNLESRITGEELIECTPAAHGLRFTLDDIHALNRHRSGVGHLDATTGGGETSLDGDAADADVVGAGDFESRDVSPQSKTVLAAPVTEAMDTAPDEPSVEPHDVVCVPGKSKTVRVAEVDVAASADDTESHGVAARATSSRTKPTTPRRRGARRARRAWAPSSATTNCWPSSTSPP